MCIHNKCGKCCALPPPHPSAHCIICPENIICTKLPYTVLLVLLFYANVC